MAERRPVIGITTDHDRGRSRHEVAGGYVAAVERAGGLPLIVPYGEVGRVPQTLDLLDGLLLTGGNDPDPAAWGEPWHPACVPVDPARERFERALLAESQRRRLPTLGICFGMQLMNLVRGGSLIQFLPEHRRENPLEHRKLSDADWSRRHPVRLMGSLAERLDSTELSVNSNHRQAVGRLGDGLLAAAVAPDGVIEAVEDPSMPLFLGVQWHPERLIDEAAHFALFTLLVLRSVP